MTRSRNPLLTLLLGTLLGALASPGATAPLESTPRSDEEVFREVAEMFLSDPLGEEAAAAMSAIVQLGNEMDEFKVVVSEEVFVWMADEDYAAAPQLLVAFIAGNARSQLDTGIAGSDAYSGMLQVLRVYKALVEDDPELENEGLEHLLEMHADEELICWLAACED